ncbi:MAG: hypothetical protein M0C28_42230 [Candidatus Moduliflexus flocculans]|nr:hypothetical protein [Candidatus Moduliflexus flocculans]
MTVVVSRLEPSAADPRIVLARESETLVCRFAADERRDRALGPPPGEPRAPCSGDILKAVVDKKNLLKRPPAAAGPVTSP